MSDRMPAWIEIGGIIPADKADEFVEIINNEGFVDYNGNSFDATAENLVEMAKDLGILFLQDFEAVYGEFKKLEQWLYDNHIPFTRHSDAKYEFDAVNDYYRPTYLIPKSCFNSTQDSHTDLVPRANVQEILAMIKDGELSRAVQMMEELCLADMPKLPPFMIEGVEACVTTTT